jgi:hypothetical protein
VSEVLPGEYGRALSALAKHNVEFVICGGLACFIHGSSRNTQDIDLCVRMEHDNLKRLIDAARSLNLQPRIPEPMEALLDDAKRQEWIARKNAMVFTFVSSNSALQIDVFLTYPISFEELHRKADVKSHGGHEYRVSSKQHLIQAKQMVQPPRLEDEFDIKMMKELIRRDQQQASQ